MCIRDRPSTAVEDARAIRASGAPAKKALLWACACSRVRVRVRVRVWRMLWENMF